MMLTASALLLAATLAAPSAAVVHGVPPSATTPAPSTAGERARLEMPPSAGPLPDLRRRHDERWTRDQGPQRPAALPALYVSLAAVHAVDVYSTRRAIGAGAGEANPMMNAAAGHAGAMLAAKAASTAAAIYFAERAWKKNRKGTIVLMAALNAATAAVAAHNLRSAHR